MADGRISIQIDVDGKQVNVASKELDNLEASGHRAGGGAKQAEDGLRGVNQEAPKAGSNIKKFASALGLVAIGAAAFKVLRASLDTAISRFDTLNNFPRVLQSLGVSAEESERSIQRLSDGIDGLPTLLDDIASTAQRMYSSFDDMDKATESALALNNALLGSGASADQARRGTEQYLQMLQTGNVDMQQWRTLQETMDVGLIKIAESFGYAGASAKDELYQALQDGTITMDDFNDKLIEVGTGTGVMADLARENTQGIATSLSNLRVAAARGITHILESFDKLSKEVTGRDIAQNIDSLKNIVFQSFQVIGSVIERATPFVRGFASAVQATIPVVQTLSPAIIGLMAAYAGYVVITRMTAAIQASNAVLATAMAAKNGLTLSIAGYTAAQTASTAATSAGTVATTAQTTAVRASALAIGVLTGQIGLGTAAMAVKTAATYALGAAWRFLLGPIGWITAAIGALVTAVIAVVRWFNRVSEETQQMIDDTEELGDAMDQLVDSVDSSSRTYENNRKRMEENSKTVADLAQEIDELSQKENKSAEDKAHLISLVEQLNGSMDGLNLAYSEESDMLNMTSDQLHDRIELLQEQEKANLAQERMNELRQEESEILAKLEESAEMQRDLNEQIEEGGRGTRQLRNAREELEEQEKELRIALSETKQEQEEVQQQATEAQKAILEATQESVEGQIVLFEDLSESQQEAVDSMKSAWDEYKDAATDMFDTLSDEATLTVEEMADNLEENQRIIGEWADGIALLAERGVDEGLLETLREAGPESAGHVNALVNASDEELARLSEAFAEGGNVATDALSKSLGIEESGVMDAIGHLVEDTGQTLSDQIEAADFPSIGGAIPAGMESGIAGGASAPAKAAEEMSEGTTNAAKQALGVRSPSTVFREIGKNVTEGLELGITQGTTRVLQAVERMFASFMRASGTSFDRITQDHDRAVSDIETSMNKLPPIVQRSMRDMLNRLKSGANDQVSKMRKLAVDLINPFKNTPNRFNSIGQNAMLGLNAGLNARRNQVMSTARSIANQVASTMQNALRISSPSGLMRDDVGRWVPEGVALGIRDNAKSVYDELDKLSDGMVMASTPEQALGIPNLFRSAASMFNISPPVVNVHNEVPEQRRDNRPVYAILNIDGYESRGIITYMTEEQSRQQRGIARARGEF